jgi:hypothetical protein
LPFLRLLIFPAFPAFPFLFFSFLVSFVCLFFCWVFGFGFLSSRVRRCFNAYPLLGPLPSTIGNSDLSTFARWFHSVVLFNVVGAFAFPFLLARTGAHVVAQLTSQPHPATLQRHTPAAFTTIYIHFTFLARKHLIQTPGTSIAHLQPGIVALGLALVVGGAEGWAFVAVWGGRWGLAAMG